MSGARFCRNERSGHSWQLRCVAQRCDGGVAGLFAVLSWVDGGGADLGRVSFPRHMHGAGR
jgi:hypothetical protein